MISKLTIDGFKGFEHLELPRLTRVTLLGGRNNVGKTTVLEALFMFFDRLNPQMILRQFAWRGVSVISMEPESMWAPVFNNYDLYKPIVISAVIKGNEERMTVKFNPNYVASAIPAATSGAKGLQIRTDQKPVPSYALDIIYDSKEMKKSNSASTNGGWRYTYPGRKCKNETAPSCFHWLSCSSQSFRRCGAFWTIRYHR